MGALILNPVGVYVTQFSCLQSIDFVFHIVQAICNRMVCFVGLELDKP